MGVAGTSAGQTCLDAQVPAGQKATNANLLEVAGGSQLELVHGKPFPDSTDVQQNEPQRQRTRQARGDLPATEPQVSAGCGFCSGNSGKQAETRSLLHASS